MSHSNNLWDRSKKVLFVMPFKGIDNVKEFRDAIKLSGFNVNDVSIMSIVEDKNKSERLAEISSVTYLSEKEFNFLGRLKNEGAAKVLGRTYEATFIFGDLPKRISKMLNKKNTGIKIGVNSNVNFLTINLTSEQENAHQLFTFIKNTLQKIN